jgi:hypothetical protein
MLKKAALLQPVIGMVTKESQVPRDHLMRKVEAVSDSSFNHELVCRLLERCMAE